MTTARLLEMTGKAAATTAILGLVILSSALLSTKTNGSSPPQDPNHDGSLPNRNLGGLSLSAKIDKHTYREGESMSLEVDLSNDSGDPIYLFGILSWGPSASLESFVTDLDLREEVNPVFWSDSHPLPPEGQGDFIKLSPRHFWGTHRRISLEDLNTQKPGKYQLKVVYHSPFLEKYGHGLPIWGRERGTISSNLVEFVVVR